MGPYRKQLYHTSGPIRRNAIRVPGTRYEVREEEEHTASQAALWRAVWMHMLGSRDSALLLGDLMDEFLNSSDGTAKPEVPPTPSFIFSLGLDPELKELARRCGLKRGGRKTEVIDRIVSAWQHDAPGVRSALRRAESGDTPAQSLGASSRGSSAGCSSSCGSGSSISAGTLAAGGGSPAVSSFVEGINCVCASPASRMHLATVTCRECASRVHASCVSISSQLDAITCPHCIAATLNPFAPALVGPMRPLLRLVAAASPAQVQFQQPVTHTIDFEVTSDVVAMASSGAAGTGKRIELRTFLVRKLTEAPGAKRNHRWPLRARVYLNTVELPIHQQPQAWDGHHHKDRNEDLPLILRGVRTGRNRLLIISCDAEPHIAAILLVQQATHRDLRDEVQIASPIASPISIPSRFPRLRASSSLCMPPSPGLPTSAPKAMPPSASNRRPRPHPSPGHAHRSPSLRCPPLPYPCGEAPCGSVRPPLAAGDP